MNRPRIFCLCEIWQKRVECPRIGQVLQRGPGIVLSLVRTIARSQTI